MSVSPGRSESPGQGNWGGPAQTQDGATGWVERGSDFREEDGAVGSIRYRLLPPNWAAVSFLVRIQRRTWSALTARRLALLRTVSHCSLFRSPQNYAECGRLTSLLTEAGLARVFQVGQVRRAGVRS